MVRASYPKESFLDLIKFVAELAVKDSKNKFLKNEGSLKPLIFQMYHKYFQNPLNERDIKLTFEDGELEAVFKPMLEYFIKIRNR